MTALTDQLIAVHAPLPDGERHTPVNGAIGSGVGVGLDGVFSLHLDDIDGSSGYYTGLRFRVYAGGAKVAQGGRYDNLYERFGRRAAAIGFTFTIDDLDLLTMRIAIPKGLLQDRALGVFAGAGYDVPDDADLKTRRLVFDP